MNKNKHLLFKKMPLPLVLCSESVARQAWLGQILEVIVYPFPQKMVSFQEDPPPAGSFPIQESQHLEIIEKKFQVAQQALSQWPGPLDLPWPTFIALVCDTWVVCHPQAYGKPRDRAALSQWFSAYLMKPTEVWTGCIVSLWHHSHVQRKLRVHCRVPITFTPQGHQSLVQLCAQPEAQLLMRAAGGIDVEWFQKMGWIQFPQEHFDTIVGVPWQTLWNEMKHNKWI